MFEFLFSRTKVNNKTEGLLLLLLLLLCILLLLLLCILLLVFLLCIYYYYFLLCYSCLDMKLLYYICIFSYSPIGGVFCEIKEELI